MPRRRHSLAAIWQTPWQRFQNQVTLPSIGLIDIAALLDGDYESELRALTGVGDFRDALGVLAPLPTAEPVTFSISLGVSERA